MAIYFSFFYFAVLAFSLVRAVPAPVDPNTTVVSTNATDDPFNGPSQVTTHQVLPVNGGTITQDCVITFRAIVVDGQNLVEETKKCNNVFTPNETHGGIITTSASSDSGNVGTSVSTADGSTSTDSTADSTTSDAGQSTADPNSTTTADSSSSTIAVGGASTTDSASTSTSTTTDASASTSTDSGLFGSSSSVASSSSSAASSSTTDPAGDGSSPSNGSPDGPLAVVGTSSVAASDASSAAPASSTVSSANDTASTTPPLPGKKLEVLPIGLGVFAGISVIALIVVGLVTYERTKYRKAFRQRRMAASGAEMGYGGMAERR